MAGITFTPTPPPHPPLHPVEVLWPRPDTSHLIWWCGNIDTWSQRWSELCHWAGGGPPSRVHWGHHVSLAVIWLRRKPRLIRASKRCGVVQKSTCLAVILLISYWFWDGSSLAVLCHQAADLCCSGSARRLCSQPPETETWLGKTGRCHKTV